MEGEVIGMRERERYLTRLYPPESLMHTETDFEGEEWEEVKWPHGPSKTKDNTGILNRNQRETLPQSHRPAVLQQ